VTGLRPSHTTRHAGVPRYSSPYGQPIGWIQTPTHATSP
jgi:hypothetical protein